MKPVQLIFAGGFLGAGKTTLLGQAGRELIRRGMRVGLITNDQGSNLVDSVILRRYGLLIGVVLVGACVLLVLLVAFPKKPPLDVERLETLQARIDQFEERIVQLEAGQLELAQFRTQGQRAEQLLGRMDQLEETTAQRMEELSQKLVAVETLASKPPPPQPAPKPPKAAVAAKPPPKPAPKAAAQKPATKPAAPKPAPAKAAGEYHTVKAGETLYRISRQYGLSVEKLSQLNGLSGTDIRVGQRLRVSP